MFKRKNKCKHFNEEGKCRKCGHHFYRYIHDYSKDFSYIDEREICLNCGNPHKANSIQHLKIALHILNERTYYSKDMNESSFRLRKHRDYRNGTNKVKNYYLKALNNWLKEKK